MFDYELYKKVVEIEQHLKEKYQFKKFKMLLYTDEEQTIGYQFNHFDIVNKREHLKCISNDLILLLKESGYNYKQDVLFPNGLTMSDHASNSQIFNETSIDCYFLIKEEN